MNEKYYRLYERIVAIEDNLEALGPVDKLIERIEELEKMVKQTKTVLGFDEACKYIGVSESLLYKPTAAKEVPHYKPRGKMLYFNRVFCKSLYINSLCTKQQKSDYVDSKDLRKDYYLMFLTFLNHK